jgi:hypothetical protein
MYVVLIVYVTSRGEEKKKRYIVIFTILKVINNRLNIYTQRRMNPPKYTSEMKQYQKRKKD